MQPYKGVRGFNKTNNKLVERMNKEIISEIGRLMPDKNNDPLLDMGEPSYSCPFSPKEPALILAHARRVLPLM